MRQYILLTILMSAGLLSSAQTTDGIIVRTEVERIETVLSSDDMEGRKAGTPGNEKAAQFIMSEFSAAGLEPWNGKSFEQPFTVPKRNGTGGNAAPLTLMNVVGVLPGSGKKDEYVIFSAHFDHIGTGKPVNGDSIFNGANDDAAGVTAVIMLANYFKKAGGNERTLVFAAFNAEEIGGFGSQHLATQFDPARVVAMFNIEMIGTDSKWGKNSAYITGFEKSDMGKTLQKNLKGSGFQFYPDPYPSQQLFYRSDNASLALLGVPAHTISTSKMDNEKHYHSVDDEINTLDLDNMTAIIRAIALSATSVIKGTDTPSRVAKER